MQTNSLYNLPSDSRYCAECDAGMDRLLGQSPHAARANPPDFASIHSSSCLSPKGDEVMKRTATVKILPCVSLIVFGVLFAMACTTSGVARESGAGEAGENEKGAAQLWEENCQRCHNVRDPASYTDSEWAVAMSHMRLRAGLDAKEAQKILDFLQASN